jgi:hypothetical protein
MRMHTHEDKHTYPGGAEYIDPKSLGEAEIVEEGKVGDGELLYIKVRSTMPTSANPHVQHGPALSARQAQINPSCGSVA